MRQRTTAATLVCLLLAAAAVALGAPPESLKSSGALALAAVALDCMSQRLTHFGFFHHAAALYLAAALLGGVRLAVLALLVGLLLRALLRGATLAEAVADALPALVALLVFGLSGQFLPALLFYLPISLKLPPWLAALPAEQAGYDAGERVALAPLSLGLLCLAPLPANFALESLWTTPLLLGAPLLGRALLALHRDRRALLAEMRRQKAEARGEELEEKLEQAHMDVQQQLALRVLLDSLAKAFAAGPDFNTTLALTLQKAAEVTGCPEALFYARGPSGFQVFSASGPVALEGPVALVEEAWHEHKLVLRSSRHRDRPTPFDHGRAAALPLGGMGVLYVGSPDLDRWDRVTVHLLALLADHSIPALNSAQRRRQLAESQAQLVQSSKLAAVGQLAAGVAHEINTPLGTVMISVQSARESVAAGKTGNLGQKLKRAEEGVRQAREIISKLLVYSRRSDQQREAVNLNRLVEDTLELLAPQLRRDQVTVVCRPQTVPPVLVNPNEVQQILVNLLLNARDAVAQVAAPDIVIATEQRGDEVLVRVRDNGSGMSEALRERIFEPFFTTRPVGRGTGLGLSISLELAENNEGRLEVESIEGQGSIFTLAFPIPS